MNSTGRYWVAQLVVNFAITLAFLGFAWLFRTTDKSIAALVMGQALAHWFRESSSSGKAIPKISPEMLTATEVREDVAAESAAARAHDTKERKT